MGREESEVVVVRTEMGWLVKVKLAGGCRQVACLVLCKRVG